jgi:hypothetical protein
MTARPNSDMPLPSLKRVRWAVRSALVLGVAASVSANVLHAERNPISQVIAAWPPLALLVTIELIARVPMRTRVRAAVRLVATAGIAGIAAWVSYWHMAAVASRYGETNATPYLLPFSVDGLVIVMSVCLVELGGRIRGAEAVAAELPEPEPEPSPADDPRYADVKTFVQKHLAEKGRQPGRHVVAKQVGVAYERTRALIDHAVAELTAEAESSPEPGPAAA